MLLLVCLSAEMEVAEKSRREKLPTAEYSNGGYGLPKLTTERNPKISILKLFYGFDTMLRENEYTDSH